MSKNSLNTLIKLQSKRAETSRGKKPKRLGADFSKGANLVWGRNVLFAL
jgi:hypothetical protein